MEGTPDELVDFLTEGQRAALLAGLLRRQEFEATELGERVAAAERFREAVGKRVWK